MKFRSFYRTFFFAEGPFNQSLLKTLGNLAFILLSLYPDASKAQADIENIEQLRKDTANFVTAEYRASNASRVEVKVGGLDPRLHLEKCSQPVAFKLQDSSGNGGNSNVQTACQGRSRWNILIPVQAIVYRPVAIASRNLQRGELVGEADINISELDVSQYRQGYSKNAEQIIGKELKYPMNKGDAFRDSILDAPIAIKRGDEVSVEALAGSIRVITTGTAVSDGRVGQKIRVKNNNSAKILSATVIGAGKVQSIL
ncbi:MAG TPA: flagellar basal body P-ring formation chaperone FlgA [Cellvibrio sp.]|nr:flagellar basal body P-ring formation chaperone FlgA [Cellvibrio sp.]